MNLIHFYYGMRKVYVAGVLVSFVLGTAPVFAQETTQKPMPSEGSSSGPVGPMMGPGGFPGGSGPMGPGGFPGGPGPMGPNNFGPGPGSPMGPGGMSDEDFQKQDEERQKRDDERMKKEQERNLKMMKSNMNNFTRGLSQMKKQMERQQVSLKKCGVGMPQDVSSALSESDALIAKAKASTDFEELQGLQEELNEKMQTIGQSQGQFGYLQGFCRMLPEADKMIKRAQKEYNRVAKAAARNKDLDISSIGAEFTTALDAQKALLQQIKQAMTSDPEEAMEMMQSDFFPGFEDVFNKVGHLDALVNSEKGIKMLEAQVKRAKKSLDKLKKKDEDVDDLSSAISELEAAIKEAKEVRKQKGFEPEDLMSAFEEAFSALQSVSDQLEEFGIYSPEYTKNMGPQKGPQFNIPSFGGGSGPQMGPGKGPMGPGQGPMGPGNGPQGPGGFGPDGGDDFGPEAKALNKKQVAKK